MDRSKLEITRGVWLDCRRALFLEEERVLCVADLHLGYEWAHRHAGQLLPVRGADELIARLGELCEIYRPKRVAVLGDIVHRAVPVEQITAQLAGVVQQVCNCAELDLIVGNHDRGLRRIVPEGLVLLPHARVQGYLLVHGDEAEPVKEERIVMGHEHPAIRLGDGVRAGKFPCFVCGPRVTILPAFSNWAGGSEVRTGAYLSRTAREADFSTAVAILGTKLLPVPLK